MRIATSHGSVKFNETGKLSALVCKQHKPCSSAKQIKVWFIIL